MRRDREARALARKADKDKGIPDLLGSNLTIHTPTVATSGLIQLTLSLGFLLDHCDNLGMGLHYFGIGEHISAARKVLKARA